MNFSIKRRVFSHLRGGKGGGGGGGEGGEEKKKKIYLGEKERAHA